MIQNPTLVREHSKLDKLMLYPTMTRPEGARGVLFIGKMALILTLFGVGGCAKSPPASQFPSAQVALERMKATYGCAVGIQGDGKLDHMNRTGRIRGDVMLMAVDPARVRFDIVSPFGVTLATLTSDGRRFSFFDMQNERFLEGPPLPCNIARLTQVRMPAHALVRLLRGEAPLLVHRPESATIAWNSGGYYEVTIAGNHETNELVHLEPLPEDFDLPYMQQRVRVLRVVVTQRNYTHFDAILSDHSTAVTMNPRVDELGLDPPIPPSGPACWAQVPRKIQVTVPYTTDDLRFRYHEVGLNPPLPEGVFEQPVPGGVRRRYVTCQ